MAIRAPPWRLTRSILSSIDTPPLKDPAATMASVGEILGTSMGGSSGVLLSIFFTAASKAASTTARWSTHWLRRLLL